MPFRAAVSPHQEHVSGAAATGSAFAGEKGLFFKKSIPSGQDEATVLSWLLFPCSSLHSGPYKEWKIPF